MEAHSDEQAPEPMTRRVVLRGVAVGGAAVAGGALLAACGDDTTSGGNGNPSPAPNSGPSTQSGGAGGDLAEVLVATAEVPEGGGVVLPDAEVVVTQPTAGDFKAFSAICTHQGCTVGDVAGGVIICPCHGSQFSVEDGSVTAGPAPSPLPEVAVTVDGKNVVRA
jgi:Rieske Fe-S protein